MVQVSGKNVYSIFQQIRFCDGPRRVISEFWRQGDLERIHGLPVGPGRDRQTANVPLGQQFFNKVLVRPLYKLWKEGSNYLRIVLQSKIFSNFTVVPEADVALKILNENLAYWASEVEAQRKEQKKESASIKQPCKQSRATSEEGLKQKGEDSFITLHSRKKSGVGNPNKRREFVPAIHVADTI